MKSSSRRKATLFQNASTVSETQSPIVNVIKLPMENANFKMKSLYRKRKRTRSSILKCHKAANGC